MSEASMSFRSRGIGLEWNLPDFVTGEPSKGADDLKPNICAYVDDAAGVSAMFNGQVRISRGRIMVGVAERNIAALEALHTLVEQNNRRITPDLIAQAKIIGLGANIEAGKKQSEILAAELSDFGRRIDAARQRHATAQPA